MNTRSLRFQLVAWYAGLLTGCFVLIGAATYRGPAEFAGRRAARKTNCGAPGRSANCCWRKLAATGEARVGEEIEARYAPGLNDRFVRITRSDGSVLYRVRTAQRPDFRSRGTARSSSGLPGRKPRARSPLPAGRKMLLTAREVQTPGGARYLVETGRRWTTCRPTCASG